MTRIGEVVKIAVCLPTGDLVHTNFAFSIWTMLTRTSHELDLLNVRSSLLVSSRYMLANKAIERGNEAVFFVDSDISFPPDALDRLVAHDVPFVGATYVSRYPPHPVIGQSPEAFSPGEMGLHRMDYMPVGFSLTRTEVFKKVPRPWYQMWYDPETDSHVAEDYGFCVGLREAGYKVWCDLALSHELKHEGSQLYAWGET